MDEKTRWIKKQRNNLKETKIEMVEDMQIKNIIRNKTGFWWHAQNLNDAHGLNGSMWVNGRAWLEHTSEFSIGQEWNLKSSLCGIGITVNPDESKISIHGSFPPIALYTTCTLPFKYYKYLNALTNNSRRDTSISFHDWTIFVCLWNDNFTWRNNKKFWEQWKWSLNILDFIFGKWKYTERIVEERDVIIPMPEGNYPAKAKIFESTWKRPFWFPRKMIRSKIEIKNNQLIPFPGKGENSWDCGMDGLGGMTSPDKTIEAAIGAIVGSVLRSRRRYGGIGWEPEEKDVPLIVAVHKAKERADATRH